MMSRRKRNTYLVLMVAGGIALAVDRFVLSGNALTPQVATAGLSLPGPTSLVQQHGSSAIPELPFPRNIPLVADFSVARNPFLRPGTGGGDSNVPHNASANGRNGLNDGPVSAEMFVAGHKLDGVVIQAGLKIAVLDGAWVKVGQTVDGCSCSEIKDNEVRFDCTDSDAVLHVTLPR